MDHQIGLRGGDARGHLRERPCRRDVAVLELAAIFLVVGILVPGGTGPLALQLAVPIGMWVDSAVTSDGTPYHADPVA